MAGQRQSQSGFGNQYPSGQMRMPTYGGQGQPDKDNEEGEYAQACSHVSQQLRAQIGDQRPAWDGQIPGFWDRQPQAAVQQEQSNAMNQQNQLRRPATSFGQDRQQQQQQYMGGDNVNEASHFHAQDRHFRASQLQKAGGGVQHGGVNRAMLPSTGMQQAPGQNNNGQPYHNTNLQSATMMPGPNLFAPGQPGNNNHQSSTMMPSPNLFTRGQPGNNNANHQSASMMPSPNLFARGQPGNTANHQSATMMPGANLFAPGQSGTFGQQGRNQSGYAPSPSNNNNAQVYPSSSRTNRGGNNNP